jgi:hypothetical protein
MKWPEFLTDDSDFPATGLSILCRIPAREEQGEPIELSIGLRGIYIAVIILT